VSLVVGTHFFPGFILFGFALWALAPQGHAIDSTTDK